MFSLIQILHAFLDIFAGGRSNAKVYLFIIYFFVLLVILFLVKKQNEKINKISKIVFFLSLIFGHILAAVTFLNFAHNYGFDANDFVITFNNNEVSSSQLSHNHVLKGSVAEALNLFKKGNYENVDAGLPFLGLISKHILWGGLILIIIAAISSLFLFATEIVKRKGRAKKVVFFLAFLLAAFPLIKAIADGGIFLASSLPILAVLIFGIFDEKDNKKGIKIAAATIVIYFIWTAIAWKNFFFEENYQLTIHLTSSAIPFAILLVLFLLEKFAYKRETYLFGIIVLLALVFYPMFKELDDLSNYRSYMATESFVAIYGEPEILPGPKISNINNLNFYKIEEAISVDGVIKKYGLLDNTYPVAIPWKTCVPTAFGDKYSFSLNVGLEQNTDLQKFGRNSEGKMLSQINSAQINKVSDTDNISKYNVFVTIKSCTPRHLNVIQELLKTQFAEPFFVYNIEKL